MECCSAQRREKLGPKLSELQRPGDQQIRVNLIFIIAVSFSSLAEDAVSYAAVRGQ
jgi:hypothetical protein